MAGESRALAGLRTRWALRKKEKKKKKPGYGRPYRKYYANNGSLIKDFHFYLLFVRSSLFSLAFNMIEGYLFIIVTTCRPTDRPVVRKISKISNRPTGTSSGNRGQPASPAARFTLPKVKTTLAYEIPRVTLPTSAYN